MLHANVKRGETESSLSFVVGMVKTQNSVITDLKQKRPPLLLTLTLIKAVLTFDWW